MCQEDSVDLCASNKFEERKRRNNGSRWNDMRHLQYDMEEKTVVNGKGNKERKGKKRYGQ